MKGFVKVKMAAAWSRRLLIGAHFPRGTTIGCQRHVTPPQHLLSAAPESGGEKHGVVMVAIVVILVTVNKKDLKFVL